MAEQDNAIPVPRYALAACLAAAFFVSPLLFFTGLTRNPYYLQITLLNVAVLAACALFIRASARAGTSPLAATPLSRPLGALALVYLLSFAVSYAGHKAFFRPAMASEGFKAGLFFVVNCLAVFYISLRVPFSRDGEEVPAGSWLAFVLGWGALWLLFPWLRMPSAGDGLFDRLFDPYGALVWTAGFTAAVLLLKRCRQEDVLHLALSAGAIASLYGILEYFHLELVWAKLVNPYGNRSVSTFGNPNFISSYLVILLPLAASLLMKADTRMKKFYYGLVFLSYEGMLMSSLTRSSWIGAAAAFAVFFSFAACRRRFKANRKFLYPFFAAALLLLVFWPSDDLKPFSSGLFSRVSEAVGNVDTASSVSLAGDAGGKVYASFHQRLLIWTSAWQMGLENPLTGNGWGQFELFYPFFQGRLMANYPAIRPLRTHANNAHNELLEQWSQAGIVGLGIYLWFLLTLFWGVRRLARSAQDGAVYAAAPLAAGLAGVLADNMLNVSIHFAVPAFLFWWTAGALAQKASCSAAPAPLARPAFWRKASWVLLLCCAAGVVFWQRQFMREFHYFNGFRAMRAGSPAYAAAELERAWQYHSREVNSNYEMANAYVRAGDLQKGLWAYGEAIKSNAGYDEIYFNLAIIQKRLGLRKEALDNLRLSTVINPLNPMSWQAMAELYLLEPDRSVLAPRAAREFAEAVRMFPDDGNMWNTLGYFHTLSKDYKSARAAYGRGVKADPDNRMLAENLAGVSRQLGEKNDPDMAWLASYARLSAAAASTAGPSGADLKAADALLAGAEGGVKARTLRAKLLFKAGKLEEARADLEEVLRASPADNSARYGLAVIYEKTGRLDLARAEWRRFLEQEPANAAVAQRLAALR